MLTAQDSVTWEPRRIAVAGTTGSGKTTLARRLSRRFDLPYVEIDSLYHGPRWVPRPTFVSDVEQFIAGDSWVIEWQYRAVRGQILARADTLLWLDLPTPVSMGQLTRRTLRRRVGRIELWNGNIEPPLRTIFTDPDHILRWGFRTRNKLRDTIPELGLHVPHLHIVRFTRHRDVETWLRRIGGA
ncbi:AAA family ATPase [Mycolicibacterium fortuitum]|uniref:AAA family ATPase n=1 Tax=Mycolicibacterium fortuitum TaxID=1766 RepID=UPI001AEFA643|nr:AAA family ATPase [Mycolicibacterium fortuitum]MBP3086619.1 AAA family ATPase [Mycolicibacterium fortuitum]